MAHITEHHAKHKWKCHYGDKSWVSFSICWDTVRVDDGLKLGCECICLEVGWFSNFVLIEAYHPTRHVCGQSVLNADFLPSWSPKVANEALV